MQVASVVQGVYELRCGLELRVEVGEGRRRMAEKEGEWKNGSEGSEGREESEESEEK